MSNERDELAEVLWDLALRHLGVATSSSKHMADELLAAGYRKPRTITTLEELKTVYEGAILKDAEGDMWGIDGSTGRLFLVGDGNYDLYDDDDLNLPATVVYE